MSYGESYFPLTLDAHTFDAMDEILKNLPQRAKDTHNENKKFFTKLRKKPPKNLDVMMQELHEEEFSRSSYEPLGQVAVRRSFDRNALDGGRRDRCARARWSQQ